MGLLNKLIKVVEINTSSIEENIKVKIIESRINNLNKKLEGMNDKEGAHLIIQRDELEKSMVKKKEKVIKKRTAKKAELLQMVNASKNERQLENSNLSTFKKIRKELDNLPIVTMANDLASGISEIEKVKEKVKEQPNNLFVFLELAETLRFYRKTFIVINGMKAPIDPIGSTIDIGTEVVGGKIEGVFDKDKWTYEKAIEKAKSLGATEEQIEEFSKSYSKNIASSVVKGTGHMLYKQGEKLLVSSERVLDFAIEKIIKDKDNS